MDNEALMRACELLETGVSEHNGQMLVVLDKAFDQFEVKFGTYRGEGQDWVHYIRGFVGSWIDASNHEWNYHDPIRENDWVAIAGEILEAVKTQKDFSPVSLRGKTLNEF